MAGSLKETLIEELQDLYDAEHQITQALPKMIQAASAQNLKAAFQEHLDVTRNQIERLEQVFERLDESPKRKHCKGLAGIIKEGEDGVSEIKDPDVRDAFLIAAAQKVEHYEIASYGTARTWASQEGDKETCRLLQQTLNEEGETDKMLTKLAEGCVNPEAAQRRAA